MSKRIFVNFVSEPKNDPLKTIVGLACASQAVADGHNVNVFFAASGVRILDGDYLDQLENELGGETPMVRPMMDALIGGATLHRSGDEFFGNGLRVSSRRVQHVRNLFVRQTTTPASDFILKQTVRGA